MSRPALRKIVQRAFPDIPNPEADELITISEIHSYPPGLILCREGAIEATFYIILEGGVQVSKVINEAEARNLKPLGPGDFFGEYALIHNAPRTASIKTVHPTTVLEVHKDAFGKLLNRSTSVSVAMVREVSRRLRENDEMAIEDLRMKAQELAMAYQKLAEQDFARREFLTTIAHELRTPLTAANGYLQIIRQGMLKGEALEAAQETVGRNIHRIVTLVNDILFLQEMDPILPETKPVDIGAVLTSLVEKQQENDGYIIFHLDIVSDLPDVQGDAESLERAFCALMENSVKFSPNGGDVNVSARAQNGGVAISIQDHGVGIPEGSLPNIFERFYRVEQISGHLFGGLGLGLAIASQVIEQHGGRIEVESKLNEGSTFTIHLDTSA